jgi:hypothetical protein
MKNEKSITFRVMEIDKRFFELYAKRRGFKNASSLAKVALFEYIRRRPDNNLYAEVQDMVEEDSTEKGDND